MSAGADPAAERGERVTDGRHHLKVVFARPDFRRLLTTRLVSQFGDGVFQASLAGAVLFNPEHQSDPADIAAGFAVLLLPYSLLGPYVGVLIDRWWRQRILSRGNWLRAAASVVAAVAIAAGLSGVPLYALALVVLSIGRFVLAALSAALPHVVDERELPTVNAFSTTAGTGATILGGGAALLLRLAVGETNAGYGTIAAGAVIFYVLAGVVAAAYPVARLGPDDTERQQQSVAQVARGLVEGAGYLRSRRAAFDGLLATGSLRLCHGITTVTTVLLYRNYFTDDGIFRAGLAGLAQVLVGTGVGGALAALITPAIVRRTGLNLWPVLLIASSAVVQLALLLPYQVALVPFAIMLTSLSSQGLKICVDTIVQRDVADEYRGRVFSLYDAVFNIALVVAAVLVAAVLPETGRAPAAPITLAGVYLVTSGWYAWATSRRQVTA